MWAPIWPDVPEDAAAGRARSPTASTCRRGSSHELARLFDDYLPGDWRERHDDPALWARVLDDSRRGALGGAQRAARSTSSPSCASGRAQRWRDEHVSAARVVAAGHAARSQRADDRLRAPLHRLQAPGADLPRPGAAAARILNAPRRPVQIVFAGKAHPADETGKHHLQQVYRRAHRSRVRRAHRVRRRLRPARRAFPGAGLRRLAEQPAQAARGERHERHEGVAQRRRRTSRSATAGGPKATPARTAG